jgi:hypothetical protein
MLPVHFFGEQINLADQFVLTFLAGDMLPWCAGALPTGTGD